MKTTNKILILIAFGAVLLGTVGCYSPITAIMRNRFFFETVYTKQLAVNNVLAYDTLKMEMQLEPRLFKCRKVNDRIESKDNLVLAGFTYLVGRRQAYELGDTSYYRWIPVDNTKGSIEEAKKTRDSKSTTYRTIRSIGSLVTSPLPAPMQALGKIIP